jgi:ABC-type transport system involved in cytochrome c biogenesis permease component
VEGAGRQAPPVTAVLRLLVWKDLRVEWRNRLRLQSLALFGAALALVAGQGVRGQADLPATLPVVIWTVVVFLQLLFLSQLYQGELEAAGFEGLRLAPIPAWCIALAKTVAGSILAGVVELGLLAMLARLTGSALPLAPGLLLLVAVETVAMVALGGLIFACTAAGEEPALDLYALVLLLVAPLVVAGLDTTRRLFQGAGPEQLATAYLLAAAYSAAMVAVAATGYQDFATPRPPHRRRPPAGAGGYPGGRRPARDDGTGVSWRAIRPDGPDGPDRSDGREPCP